VFLQVLVYIVVDTCGLCLRPLACCLLFSSELGMLKLDDMLSNLFGSIVFVCSPI
jgi:hypothetical protein